MVTTYYIEGDGVEIERALRNSRLNFFTGIVQTEFSLEETEKLYREFMATRCPECNGTGQVAVYWTSICTQSTVCRTCLASKREAKV